MGRKYGQKKINKIFKADYKSLTEPFENTIKRWALTAAQQLKDSYATQRVYNGTNSHANEVWRRNKTVSVRKLVNGKRKWVKQQVSWGWLDENQYRKSHDYEGKQWYSTGHSYDVANVTTDNVHTHKEASAEFIIQGQVTFHTTLQMLYVEQGVGANGRRKGQPRTAKPIVRPTDIAVDRQADWKSKVRYTNWVPGKGKSVRPNTRQQVNAFVKRMKWLAQQKETLEITQFIVYGLERAFNFEYVDPDLEGVCSFEVVHKPSQAEQKRNHALSQYLDSIGGGNW